MAKKTRRYVFPTPSKCPRCQTIDTEAYSTRGKVQYRRCRRAICRHHYHVIGTPIKKKEIINEKEKITDKPPGKKEEPEEKDGQIKT